MMYIAGMARIIDFILHVDTHLLDAVQTYHNGVYGLLFAIIFAETGLVVTPFLPGDSLLFAVGAIAATGALNLPAVFLLLIAAAYLGNTVNYAIGRRIGPRVFQATGNDTVFGKLLNRKYLDQAHAFFETHGGRAVVLSRFVPIVRTFLPFVAGAAQMSPRSFLIYNLVGAVGWVTVCVGAGVLFGNVPVVKENFSLVALGIVFVSILPMAYEIIKARRAASQ
ncbi:MAG: DedA family protein [Acidobacteria bacterium]|nr:MAG: DedA family protein [Acidobacteriota bacterium]